MDNLKHLCNNNYSQTHTHWRQCRQWTHWFVRADVISSVYFHQMSPGPWGLRSHTHTHTEPCQAHTGTFSNNNSVCVCALYLIQAAQWKHSFTRPSGCVQVQRWVSVTPTLVMPTYNHRGAQTTVAFKFQTEIEESQGRIFFFVCFFNFLCQVGYVLQVCLLAGLVRNYWMDLHEDFTRDGSWSRNFLKAPFNISQIGFFLRFWFIGSDMLKARKNEKIRLNYP